MTLLEVREKQVEVAIEYLEKYRTLVVSRGVGKSKSPTYRLGKSAEDALNLMAALNRKLDSKGKSKAPTDET